MSKLDSVKTSSHRLSWSLVLLMCLARGVWAEPQPMALTGWNADVVLENQANPAAVYFDDSWSGWFESGLGNRDDGLPADRRIHSLITPGLIFELQPYRGPNVVRLTRGSARGSLQLTHPAAYSRIHVLAASGNGGGNGQLVVHHTDGSTIGPLPFFAPDWWEGTPDPAPRRAAATGFARNVGTGPGLQYESFPPGFSLHQTDIDLTGYAHSGKPIARLEFTKASGGVPMVTSVFAVSGEPASLPSEPEPSDLLEVTTSAEDGPGSLRQAILDANRDADRDRIVFHLPGDGPYRIDLKTALPALTAPVVMDGSTQPGYAGTPVVEVSGASLSAADGSEVHGLAIETQDSVVRSLCIVGFPGAGIRIGGESGGDNNQVVGCHLGVDRSGTQAVPNTVGIVVAGGRGNFIGRGSDGGNVVSGNRELGIHLAPGSHGTTVQGNRVGVEAGGLRALSNGPGTLGWSAGISIQGSDGNLIGGEQTGEGNLVSGNGRSGISLLARASDNRLLGNRVGTDFTGRAAVPNGASGIWILDGSSSNRVGGARVGAGNLISGNGAEGLLLEGAPGNLVEGNSIGTAVAGTNALGNKSVGIRLKSSGHRIGGSDSGAGNVISGNASDGIRIEGASATNNLLVGNALGTDRSARIRLGNGGAGVQVIEATDNWIGGDGAGEGNHLLFNAGAGVRIESGERIRIRGNNSVGNGQIPIDLGPAGPTPNDPLDEDVGPNLLQNRPDLREAIGSGSFVLRGSLQSRPEASFRIDAYSVLTGAAPVQVPLGNRTVTTDALGNAEFELPLSGPVAGRFVLATATDAAGNTSEMSNAVTVQEGGTAVGGAVTGEVVWSGDYLVTRDVVVPAGASLTIQAGSRIAVATTDPAGTGHDSKRVEIRVTGGTLRILGTDESPVVLTSGSTTDRAGDWFGVSLEGGRAELRGCVIEYAWDGLILRSRGTYEFDGVTARNNSERALRVRTAGTYLFDRCRWTNNAFGVDIGAGVGAEVTFRDSEISDNQAHGIYSDSPLRLIDCRVQRNSFFGVTADRARVELVRCEVMRNGWNGVSVQMAGSSLVATDTRVEDNTDIGISAWTANLTNCTSLRNGGLGVFITSGSGVLNLFRCNVSTNRKDGVSSVANVRISVVDCDIHRNTGNGLTVFRTPLEGGIAGTHLTGNAIALVIKTNLTTDLTLTNCHLNGAAEIRNESRRAITAAHCSFSPTTLAELERGQLNLSRIRDRADLATLGPVQIIDWSPTPVNTLLAIRTQPESVEVAEGDGARLQVSVESPLPVAYQWRREGVVLAGETNAALRLPAVTAAKAGRYTVLVQAGFRSLISSVAEVRLVVPSLIAREPSDVLVRVGEVASFEVVSGRDGATYQWFFNGVALAGEERDVLSIASPGVAQVGRYHARVSAPGGAGVDSREARLELSEGTPGLPQPLSSEKWAELFPAESGAPAGGLTEAKAFISLRAETSGARWLDLGGSITELDDPSACDAVVTGSRWLRLRVEDSPRWIALTSSPASADVVLAVYTNRFALGQVACHDEAAPESRGSRLAFPAEPGVDYLVMVGAKGAGGVCGVTWSVAGAGAEGDPLGWGSTGVLDDRFLFRRVVVPGLYEVSAGASITEMLPVEQLRVRSGLLEFRDPEPMAGAARFYRYTWVSP